MRRRRRKTAANARVEQTSGESERTWRCALTRATASAPGSDRPRGSAREGGARGRVRARRGSRERRRRGDRGAERGRVRARDRGSFRRGREAPASKASARIPRGDRKPSDASRTHQTGGDDGRERDQLLGGRAGLRGGRGTARGGSDRAGRRVGWESAAGAGSIDRGDTRPSPIGGDRRAIAAYRAGVAHDEDAVPAGDGLDDAVHPSRAGRHRGSKREGRARGCGSQAVARREARLVPRSVVVK